MSKNKIKQVVEDIINGLRAAEFESVGPDYKNLPVENNCVIIWQAGREHKKYRITVEEV